jgi:GNAT superfamily N-acetyltransferase
MKIRPADSTDVQTICELRKEAAAWLAEIGSDQWSGTGLDDRAFASRIEKSIEHRGTWMVVDGPEVIGTIGVDTQFDQGLWTPEEESTAVSVHRMITRRTAAGRGVGTAMLSWANQVALILGRQWLRLDAWTSSKGLHQYYKDQGFSLVRTMPGHRYPSNTLFERRVPKMVPAPK